MKTDLLRAGFARQTYEAKQVLCMCINYHFLCKKYITHLISFISEKSFTLVNQTFEFEMIFYLF